jgi:DNA topoisomerase I
VQQALAHPDKINMDRVSAQEARRAMDRVVGFPLSNLLGKKVAGGLSAGRVQSVAVKLIVDREREIEAFKTEEYWKITALLAKAGEGVVWAADPAKSKIFAKKKADVATPVEWHAPTDADAAADPDEPVVDTEAEAAAPGESGSPSGAGTATEKGGLPTPPEKAFLAELVKWNGAEPKLVQREHGRRRGRSPRRGAVRRHEGRAEGPAGPAQPAVHDEHSTAAGEHPAAVQHQSDNADGPEAVRGRRAVRAGPDGAHHVHADRQHAGVQRRPEAVRDFIQNDTPLGPKYLPATPNMYASGKSAQEAHEAIRPTDVTMTPQKAKAAGLAGDQYRLYELIWLRFVASQCAPALLAVTTVEVTAGQGLFRANGRVDEVRRLSQGAAPGRQAGGRGAAGLAERDRSTGSTCSRRSTSPSRRRGTARRRWSRRWRRKAIGRPSTYSSIIGTIQKRGYVTQEKGRFFATEIGKVVTDLLVKHFPQDHGPEVHQPLRGGTGRHRDPQVPLPRRCSTSSGGRSRRI